MLLSVSAAMRGTVSSLARDACCARYAPRGAGCAPRQGLCMRAEAVWSAIASSGVLGRLAFATERAIPLCPPSACQVPVTETLGTTAL